MAYWRRSPIGEGDSEDDEANDEAGPVDQARRRDHRSVATASTATPSSAARSTMGGHGRHARASLGP